MKVLIKRVFMSSEVTLGTLAVEEAPPICLTLERPWLNNASNVSCIPAGLYVCSRVNSPKFGNVFQVLSVPARSNVLIHWGNWVSDTEGCIILGESYAILKDEAAVAQSKVAFQEFMDLTKNVSSFTLEIREV